MEVGSTNAGRWHVDLWCLKLRISSFAEEKIANLTWPIRYFPPVVRFPHSPHTFGIEFHAWTKASSDPDMYASERRSWLKSYPMPQWLSLESQNAWGRLENEARLDRMVAASEFHRSGMHFALLE